MHTTDDLTTALNAICASLYDIYVLDCKTRTLRALRQTKRAKDVYEVAKTTHDYETIMKAYIAGNVLAQDREALLYSTLFDNLYSTLQKEGRFSALYHVYRDSKTQYFRMDCYPVREGKAIEQIILTFAPENYLTAQSQLINSLEMDETTGVYSKQAFYQYAAALLEKDPGQRYDLIIADVDNFKLMNQVYGRSNGNKVLRFLAERFQIASRGGLCGRYGADQFVILTKAMTDQEFTFFGTLAKRLCEEAPLPYLTVHYGIYRNFDKNDSMIEICDKALLALRSNRNHENIINLYDQPLMQQYYRSKLYESDFERAMTNHEFVVWAQPQYNSFSKRVTSAEALVRWKTADGKLIPPFEFIPVYEEDGLIVRLDEFVFRYVCSRQKQLLNEGKEPLPVSVNLSRATLFREEIIEKYKAIIEEMAVPKELVPIELTESATIDNDQIQSLVQRFKNAGFVLHLDDFGSGYSSLSSLVTLNLNVLKLDRSLITAIGIEGGDEILRHTIELAHFLKMEVVAEGVETNDQYQFLKKLNCDTIQGYLFSKPIPFEDFLALCDTQPKEVSETMQGELLSDTASVGSLRITNDAKMQYLMALARINMTMHVIDLQEDTVVEFATTTNVKEHVNRMRGCAEQMKAAMTATVAPESLIAVLQFTDLTTIAHRMKGKRTITGEFVGKHFGRFRARFIAVTLNDNEEPVKLIYTTEVIEADKREEETLIHACRTDELTGVYNHSALEEDIKKLSVSKDLCVMVVDINGLRSVNERYGRFAGDELIWETAVILTRVLGKDSSIYRTSADHFIAVFHAEEKRIAAIQEEYDTEVKNWIGNEARKLSTSYGIASAAEFPDAALTDLIRKANERHNNSKNVFLRQQEGTR